MFTSAPQSTFFFGPLTIHWYGLCLVLGMLAGYLVIRYLLRRKVSIINYQLSIVEFDSLFFWLVVWGFIGARIYHVLNEPMYYWQHLIEIPQFWRGGMAIHGAILAGVIVIWYFAVGARNNRIRKFFGTTDLLVIGLSIGQSIGRWGNYFNQELFGRPTDGFLKIFIDVLHRPAGFEAVAYYHPTFLYESALNFVLFIVLLWGYRRYKGDRVGIITAGYFLGYGLIRFFIDFLRLDPRPFFGELFLSQWVSLFMIVTGVVIWYTLHEKK